MTRRACGRWATQTLNTIREVRRPGGCFILNEKMVAELQTKVWGEVIGPESKQYDEARKVYNAMIDKRPSVIVRCLGVADVIAAVKAARSEGLTVAVRGGGHSVPGFGPAGPTSHEDLFWALRGGGGNFGIVTNFEFRLHPVQDIVGGPMFFEVEDAPKVIRAYDRYITNAPRELGAFFAWQIAPPLPFIPEERHGDTLCAMVVCWTGKPAEAKKAFAPFREAAPTVAEWIAPMPYPALNGAFDGLVPPGIQHYWKAVFVRELTDNAIEAHLEHGPKIPVVNSTMHIYPINGAVHDVPADATAFGHRDAKFATVIAGMWPDPAQNKANTKWVRDYYAALAPHSEKGGYVNFAAGDDADRVGASYGKGYERLRKIKAKYDPQNVLRHNQNIVPAA